MKRTTIEFMIGWLDALRRDDVEGLKATLAPDVVWQGLRDEWVCHGPDAVIDTFAGEREAKREIGALELIGADDRVILHASGGDIVAIEDHPLPDGIYNVFTLAGGTITRIDDYAVRDDALTAAGAMTAEKAVVRRLVDEVMNAGRLDVADELCTPAMARRWRAWVAPFLSSFPDMRMEIVQLVGEGDTVVGRFTCSATHTGEWRGEQPTGRRFENVDEVYFFAFENGRIADAWGLEDTLDRMRQLQLR